MHKVVEAARLLKLEDNPPSPMLFTSRETEAEAEALLGRDKTPILAIAPAANWVGKAWPAERFAVAAAELMADGGPLQNARLMLLGGPDDRWASETVRRVITRDRLIDLVGRVDLLTAYACLKRVRLFVGNDSGLMHLAAAAGAPTVGLFGPSEMILAGGAICALAAAGVQGALVGGSIRRLKSGALDEAAALRSMTLGQRIGAGLLAVTLITMVAAPHAG